MRRIIGWALAAAVITAIFGTVYVTAQQMERQGADDAPTRLASQVASRLASGSSLDAAEADQVDIGSSEATFFVVYSGDGSAEHGSARFHGALPDVPKGVLGAARPAAPNHVTWQPDPGHRFATVEVRSGNEVVLAGQSLAPDEARIDRLGLLVLAGWGATMLLLAAGWLLLRALR
jgi:hypothetical protein